MGYNVASDIKWIRENESDLVRKYPGKFIVVREQKVTGSYSFQDEALQEAEDKFGAENYLLYHLIYDPFVNILSDPVERLANVLLADENEEKC